MRWRRRSRSSFCAITCLPRLSAVLYNVYLSGLPSPLPIIPGSNMPDRHSPANTCLPLPLPNCMTFVAIPSANTNSLTCLVAFACTCLLRLPYLARPPAALRGALLPFCLPANSRAASCRMIGCCNIQRRLWTAITIIAQHMYVAHSTYQRTRANHSERVFLYSFLPVLPTRRVYTAASRNLCYDHVQHPRSSPYEQPPALLYRLLIMTRVPPPDISPYLTLPACVLHEPYRAAAALASVNNCAAMRLGAMTLTCPFCDARLS